jgi:hypothetical protein
LPFAISKFLISFHLAGIKFAGLCLLTVGMDGQRGQNILLN